MATAEKIWDRCDPDADTVAALCEDCGSHSVVSTALASRGITDPDAAERFLNPSLDDLNDPGTLPDVPAAAGRIETALARNETITVYGHGDVDGVTGTAILLALLRDLDATVGYHLPGKWDSFGVHEEVIGKLADRGTDLLITVDCGTTSREPIAVAESLGIDVIVTDHHAPEDDLPEATACINPRRTDSQYPQEELAGATVAFKLGQALLERLESDRLDEFFDYGLPLAGLATVADRIELHQENRAIVRTGYERLPACPLDGFRTVAEDCGLDSIRDLGWSLAPLLNAAQEDPSGNLMLQVLLATDGDRIRELVDRLETYREERRAERRQWQEHLDDCVDAQVDSGAHDLLIVETDNYVGGGPKNRVAERFGKPVIGYYRKGDQYRGGGRTDPDIDLLSLFEPHEDLLDHSYGHPGAAGFHVQEENLEAFLRGIRDELTRQYEPADLRPRIEIASPLALTDVTEDLISALEVLRPFGIGAEAPRFLFEDVTVESVEPFGDRDVHLRYRHEEAACGMVEWHGGHRLGDLQFPGAYDVVGTVAPGSDGYGPTVNVDDMRPSGRE